MSQTASHKGAEPQYRWIPGGETVVIQGIGISRGNFYLCDNMKDGNVEIKIIIEDYDLKCSQKRVKIPMVISNLEIRSSKSVAGSFSEYETMDPGTRYLYLKWLSRETATKDVNERLIHYYTFGCTLRMYYDPNATNTERNLIFHEIMKIHKEMLDREDSHTLGISERHLIDSYINSKYYVRTENLLFDLFKFYYSAAEPICQKHQDTLLPLFQKIEQSERNQGFFDTVGFYFNKYQSRHYSIYIKDFLISDPYSEFAILSKISKLFENYNELVKLNKGEISVLAMFQLPEQIDITSEDLIIKMIEKLRKRPILYHAITLNSTELLSSMKFTKYHNISGSLSLKIIDLLIDGLYRIGFSIIPNYRIDESKFSFDENIYIQPLDENPLYVKKGESLKEDKDSLTFRLLLQLIVLPIAVCQQDGHNDEDLLLLDSFLRQTRISSVYTKYLISYYRWKRQEKRSITYQVKKCLNKLQRENNELFILILRLLNSLVYSGNHPRFERKYYLEKLLSNLTIAEDALPLYIKAPSFNNPVQVKIDSNALLDIEKQTEEAHKVLDTIFVDDTSNAVLEAQTGVALAPGEREILSILFAKAEWPKQEVAQICKERGLMTSAVLEKLNDYSYNKINDAIIDDSGDSIYVELAYKDKL
jgi:hypothetical protein